MIPINEGCTRENYEALWRKATGPNAEPIDVNTLGVWFERYGQDFWNGEYYDASGIGEPTGSRKLYPVYQTVLDEDCQEEIFCYSLQ